jgi:hypothetical protein
VHGIEVHSKFWRENVKEKYHLEDVSIDLKITIKWILLGNTV